MTKIKTLDELLEEATQRLWDATEALKAAELEKEQARSEFFRLLDLLVEEQPLRIQSVEVDYEDIDRALGLAIQVEKEFPGWKVLDVEDSPSEGVYIFVLQEDPSFQKAVYTNKKLGKTFGRTVSTVGESFDVDGFWTKETTWADEVVDETIVRTVNEKKARNYLANHPELVPAFQEYITPGHLQVKLTPVRDVSAEDLT